MDIRGYVPSNATFLKAENLAIRLSEVVTVSYAPKAYPKKPFRVRLRSGHLIQITQEAGEELLRLLE